MPKGRRHWIQVFAIVAASEFLIYEAYQSAGANLAPRWRAGLVSSALSLEGRTMKILDMEVCPKRKTDEEYVEWVRRLVARSKWVGVFHVCGFVFFLAVYLVIWRMIYSPESPLRDIPVASGTGWYIGVMLGVFAGVQLVFAVQNAIWAGQRFRGFRTERLMLRFHDELRQSGGSFQQSDEPNGASPRRLS
jgi:hypothetical protein